MKSSRILFLFPLFLIGVFGNNVETVSLMEGDSITLHTYATIQNDEIIHWKFKQDSIAILNIGITGKIKKTITPGAFKDRLLLDNQTGDLKIMKIRISDSGPYRFEISRTEGLSKTFNLYVTSAKSDPVSVKEGDSVTLLTKIRRYDLIQWRFGPQNSLVVEINRNTENPFPDGQFRDSLKADFLTGDLFIKNIRTNYSGLYEVGIRISNTTIHKSFNVTVSDAEKMLSVTVGDSVTLNSNLNEIWEDYIIMWMFRDTLIAEIIKAVKKFYTSSGPNEIFRDRLKLDHQNGSLTIKDTTITDSGLYETDINTNRYTVHKRFTVTVNGMKSVPVTKGNSVTLHTGVTKIQSNDVVQWRFGDQGIIIARLNSPAVSGWSNINLNGQTGDLSIGNIQKNQFGDYRVEIITSSMILRQKFLTIDSSESSTERLVVAGIGMFLIGIMMGLAIMIMIGIWKGWFSFCPFRQTVNGQNERQDSDGRINEESELTNAQCEQQ